MLCRKQEVRADFQLRAVLGRRGWGSDNAGPGAWNLARASFSHLFKLVVDRVTTVFSRVLLAVFSGEMVQATYL